MDKLNNSKRAIKGTITKIETFVEESRNHTPTKLDIKLKRVQEMNRKIDELKDQYYDIKDISESGLQVIEADIQSMEDRLEELEVRIRDILNSLIAKYSVSSVYNHENAISQANFKLKLEIKLPEIPLPVFRGRYDEWPSFKSQFDNIITNNNDLSESQKLYYLKASLQGDAKLLEAVDDSFESLITALKTRFENKRLLTETHINAILEIEKLTSESARDIRTMTDILSKNIRALKLLGFERNNLSDLILLNIILKKIDRETRKQFEQSIDSNQIPELDTFIMFLEKISQTIDSINRSAPITHKPKQVPFHKGEITLRVKQKAKTVIQNKIGDFSTPLELLIVPYITSTSIHRMDATKVNISSNIDLADKDFGIPGEIDMLIGCELFFELLRPNKFRSPCEKWLFQETVFGYIVVGSFDKFEEKSYCCLAINAEINSDNLNQQLQAFWEIEKVDESSLDHSLEEKICETQYQNTHYRTEEGRYVVQLPLKKDPYCLGSSRFLAVVRLNQLWKKLPKHYELQTLYKSFLQEYIDLNHMQLVADSLETNISYFLPHHGVFRPDSKTTKLRMILWKDSVDGPVQTYKLNTVTYGSTCAPYLATRTIQQLARDEGEHYPLAASVTIRDIYMDDILTGSSDFQEFQKLQLELINLFKKAGMSLHKWCSNTPEILNSIPKEEQSWDFHCQSSDQKTIKTLGIIWSPQFDYFSFKTVVNCQWDEPLSNPIAKEWNDFVSTLPVIQNIHVPRLVIGKGRIIIHGFADASTAAYGAVLYAQSISEEDVSTRLLCSKSRVAPVKPITIPRLELCVIVTAPGKAWIQRSPEQLKTFIGNRIKIIQRLTQNCQWNHVSSNANPVDLISRGLNASDISSKQLGWHGPDFLREELEANPIDFERITSDSDYLKELKPANVLLTSCKFSLIDDLSKHTHTRSNNYTKLLHILSYIFRFLHNSRNPSVKRSGQLDYSEVNEAELCLIKNLQASAFQEEIEFLAKSSCNSKKASKAVHLEIVSDLTTDAFLAALKRFVARRGKGISWNFMPPRAPNFGGLWEAGVKSFKFYLKRAVGNLKMTLEEFLTIITQIEGVLNSRPITPLSVDIDDLEVLTPGHFLIGRPITSISEPNLLDKTENTLFRWQKLTKIVQHIWTKWSRDYLNNLQQRNKWQFHKDNVKLNTMALIKDDNLPVNKWSLGRITKLPPSTDGKVRVVEIKTNKGNIKRSIGKVCVLPLDN
ncbi:uncharacterized protein TNCV_2156851 [Trichonephila clavipes]|nr:uncharacterized protein TNCV_2156851 [Trichonephila clavipes]